MGSFTDLNAYAAETINFNDLRAPGPRFNLPIETAVFTNTATSGTFPITRQNPTSEVLIEVTEIIRPDVADFSMAVDVSSVPGAVVSWPVVPSGCVVLNPATGIYVIEGIDTVAIWDQIKNPNIVLPSGFAGVFQYIVGFGWYGETGETTTGYIVGQYVPVAYLPSEFSLTCSRNRIRPNGTTQNSTFSLTGELKQSGLTDPEPFEFKINTTLVLNNYFEGSYIASEYFANITPQVNDPEIGKIWTVTVTPSITTAITSMSSSGSGGTSVFNGTSKVLTITGDYVQVNSHLSSLTIQFSSVKTNLNLVYNATNDTDDVNDTKTQFAQCFDVKFLALPTVDSFLYNEDTNYIIQGHPEITGPDGNYTLTITPSSAGAVETYVNLVSWNASINNSTKVLTLTGTKSELNSLRGNIIIDSGGDFVSNFTLTFALTTSTGLVNSHAVNVNINEIHAEAENITNQREFAQQSLNSIFTTNTPQIIDLEEIANYTVTLTSSVGIFSTPSSGGGSGSFTLSGDKFTINNQLPLIRFTPNYEASYDGLRFETHSIGYSQTKVGTGVQATGSMTLRGPKVGWGGTISSTAIPVTEGVNFSWPSGLNLAGSNDFATAAIQVKWIAPTDCTVTFASMPAGCSLSTESITISSIVYTAYTVTGIDSVADYNAVKTPTLVFPIGSTLGSRKLYQHTQYTDWSGSPVINTFPNWNLTLNPSPYFSSYTTTATHSMGLTYAFTAPSIVFNDGGVGTWTVEIRGKSNVNGLFSSFTTSGSGSNSTQAPGDGFYYTYRTITGSKSSVNSALATLQIVYGARVWEDISVAQVLFTAEWSERSGQSQSSSTANISFTQQVSNAGVNRTFLSNQNNVIFSTDAVRITEANPLSNTWTFRFQAASGQFYQPDPFVSSNSTPTNDLTITFGTVLSLEQYYSRLDDVEFYPTPGSTANTTYTFTVSKNGVAVSFDTITLTRTGAGSIGSHIYTFTDEDNTEEFFPLQEYQTYGKIEYLVVGGGGYGGGITNGTTGGGAGGLVLAGTITNPQKFYTIEVGYGGTVDDSVGGSTELRGGSVYPTTAQIALATGGNRRSTNTGASNSLYNGGAGTTFIVTTTQAAGGGGAGSGGAGFAATTNNPYRSGLGGNGTASSISGSSVTYARGGTGGATSSLYYNPDAPTTQTPGSGGGVYNGALIQNGAKGTVILKITNR